MKLDKVDWKLLKALTVDARAPLIELAKKTRLSKTGVHYRLKNLEETGVIKGYKAKVNNSMLGLNAYGIYLKLFNITPSEEIILVKDLKKLQEVRWLVSSAGKWDLMLAVDVKNNKEFQKILETIIIKFKNKILEYDFSIILSTKKIWMRNISEQIEEIKEISSEIITLDDKDQQIISILKSNAREKLLNIANKINLSAEAVSYRIKNLIKKKVIHSFEVSLDINKLNLSWYQLQIQLNDPIDSDKLLSKINQLSDVGYLVKVVGKWNFEIHLYCESIQEFRNKLIEIRTLLLANIKDYEINMITEKHT